MFDITTVPMFTIIVDKMIYCINAPVNIQMKYYFVQCSV